MCNWVFAASSSFPISSICPEQENDDLSNWELNSHTTQQTKDPLPLTKPHFVMEGPCFFLHATASLQLKMVVVLVHWQS
jgi:hypothetical protein